MTQHGNEGESGGTPEKNNNKDAESKDAPALVVGIGASAGGLEALAKLIEATPAGSGLAYIVVQHLDPARPSLLVEILSRHTTMQVKQAEDDAALGPDELWLIPPNSTLTVQGGRLRLSTPAELHHHLIDRLLCSLAEDQGDRAAAILVSGTGDDGTVGLRAIREHGGLTLAQAPDTATHPGMPQSAILAGVVDDVLRVEDIPARLRAHIEAKSGRAPAALAGGDRQPARDGDNHDLIVALPHICEILKRRTGNDFSGYKQGTLIRRIRRRLEVQRSPNLSEYIQSLAAEDSPEPGLLLRDLLIAVTQFFRDARAFEALAAQALPEIVRGASVTHPVRVWVPGCATGEEAYSIALLLAEQMERDHVRRPVQIFATDIDAEALQTARAARYGEELAEHLSPTRLSRFFVHQHGGYHVVKELREMCVFSLHNLVRDPPFSALDLVSCRNVLIYFEPRLQNRVLPLFHYGLRRGGYLFLGPSEDMAAHSDLFAPLDKSHRLFQRKETGARASFDFPLRFRPGPRGPWEGTAGELGARTSKQSASVAFDRMILEEYAPACALVDERGLLVSVGGRFSRYFAPRAGVFTGNILDHAEGTLRHALRTALADVGTQGKSVATSRVLFPVRGEIVHLELTVRPAPGGSPAAGLWAIVLTELPLEPTSPPDLQAIRSHEPLIEQLESELQSTRGDLQAAVDELESTNQELRSSNEELMSTNEELQSANEELQTSKEELQSVNEELETVNAELREMVKELGSTNSDLQNLLASTSVATIFLNRDLAVTRFTPAATGLFSLIDTDIGRPLADLVPRFAGTDLIADVRAVLAHLSPVEKEVHTDGAWFMLRVLPYRTVDDVIAGAVVTFTDVTRLKAAESAVRGSERLLKDIIDASPLIVLLKDTAGRFMTVNRQFLAFAGKAQEAVIGKTAHDIFPPEVADRHVEHDRQVIACAGTVILEEARSRDDGEHTYLVYRFPIHDSQGKIYGISGILQDITERKRLEQATREAERRDREVLESMPQLVWTCRADGQWDFLSRQWSEYTGVAAESHLGFGWLECVHTDDRAGALEQWEQAVSRGATVDIKLRLRGKEGGYRWFRSRGVALRGDDGRVVRWIGTSTDIDDLVHAEEASAEANRHKNEFLAALSHELRNPLVPIRTSLHILTKTEPGSEVASRALEVIDRQVNQLARLIDDLLDVTRISEAKIRLQKERLDLRDLVAHTLDDHRALFEKSGVVLESELPAEAMPVHADQTRIAQVVGNLLQNAAKFTSPGGRTRVTLRLDPSKEYNLICIEDDGIGMAPETIERLFQPFVQADITLDRSKGGLGLGLALVKNLVELHGGQVRAQSAGLGKGSLLEVRLPVARGTAASSSGARAARKGDGPQRRVLVIDDNVDGAETLRDFLELGGHEVDVAHDGASGLALARERRPDAVVCDIGLPGMDGYEVARAMREDAALQGTFLIALTGYALPEDIEKAEAAGFDRHLSKPPDIEKLEALLRHLGSSSDAATKP